MRCTSVAPTRTGSGLADPSRIVFDLLPTLAALLSRWPLRLADLPDGVRDAVGRAIDLGAVRLVLDAVTGDALVVVKLGR
jgi:hypothetical protein